MEQRVILVNLLIKLGVAAALSSALVRSLEFKRLLFREERSLKQQVYLVLWFAIPMMLAVWIRFSVKSFFAGDLSLETTVLLGVLAGRFPLSSISAFTGGCAATCRSRDSSTGKSCSFSPSWLCASCTPSSRELCLASLSAWRVRTRGWRWQSTPPPSSRLEPN